MLRYMFDLGPFRAFSGIRIKNSVNHAFNEVMGTAQPRLLFKKEKKKRVRKKSEYRYDTSTHLFFIFDDSSKLGSGLPSFACDDGALTNGDIKASSQDPIDRSHGVRNLISLSFSITSCQVDKNPLIELAGGHSDRSTRYLGRYLVHP